ncbi:MAG: hypothetical protein IJR44_00240, partial [Neisseriaceae bacterium]|nr:hypothetical protein [Neisseriaceae bacterium]
MSTCNRYNCDGAEQEWGGAQGAPLTGSKDEHAVFDDEGVKKIIDNTPVLGNGKKLYDDLDNDAPPSEIVKDTAKLGAEVLPLGKALGRGGLKEGLKEVVSPKSVAEGKIVEEAIDKGVDAVAGNNNSATDSKPSDSKSDSSTSGNDASASDSKTNSSNINHGVKELIEDIINAIDNGIESVSEKLDGRNPDWGKDVLEKILKLNKVLQGAYDWIGDQWDKFMDALNRLGWFSLYDPLVLDLDGDGIELISENNYDGVLFDLNGNGIKVATQWVKGDDGLLVLDRNGNGLIDDGSELFGQDTPKTFITDTITDGFSALRQLDHNRDGKIDANDADFKNIKVWRDINSDGISQEDELFSLEELKITSLDVETGIKNGHSTFTKEYGTTGKLSDIHFDMDTVHSEYVEHLPL